MAGEAEFAENTTITIKGTIKDNANPPVAFQPTTVKLTIYDVEKSDAGLTAIVSAVVDRDITSSVTVGVIEYDLPKGDMVMIDATKDTEIRGVYIYWDYNGGADRGELLSFFKIRKDKVPTT